MAKALRVLHVACLAPPEVGGIGMSALREVEGLRVRGHEAFLVAPEIEGDKTGMVRPVGIRTLTPVWRVGNAGTLPLRRILKEGWDIVHLHYPFYGTAEWLLAIPRSVPIVLTFHMDGVLGGWREPIARVHRSIVQPWLLRQAKRIFVSSLDYAVASSMRSFVKRQDPKLVELPFGIDLKAFQPGPSERAFFGLPEDRMIFLMVGGLDRAHAFKGVDVAIRALAGISDKTVLLAIRGDGELQASFEALAHELGVAERVRFLPRCETRDLPRLYRSADVLLFPSTSGSEAFGLVAIEAQACGTPVIASDLPGVRSVLQSGKTGWIVPPRDVAALTKQMERAIQRSSDEVIRMRLEASQLAQQRYDQERHLDRLIQTYQDVCGSLS